MRNLFLVQLALLTAASASAASSTAPQVGGGSCSAAMINGTYFYILSGTVSSNGQGVPYAEFGQLVANGSGGISGNSHDNLDGQTNAYALSGNYTVQPNCTGSVSLRVNTQTQASIALSFQVINNAQSILIAVSNANEVVTGRAYRTTAANGAVQCGTGSLSGLYGFALTGGESSAGRSFLYSNSGQLSADGNGNLTAASVANFGGTFSNISGTGTYSLSSNCQGTAAITTQAGTSNYIIAVVQDGQQVLFLETDTSTTVSGSAQPQFSAPQQAVVNAASFEPGVAPGFLFSIFGTGLAAGGASAQAVPLPSNLAQTQVLLNGNPIPLIYVSAGQINAQMPTDTPTDQPVTLTVANGAGPSNTVTLNVLPAAPGLFTTNGSDAIVQNPNGSLNSSASPAHAGDVLVAYLTGGGAVNSNAWISGAVSPAGPSSVKSSYALTVGNQPAQVEYLGLTPGFVGLYQANFTLPQLTPGSYPIVVTVAGNSSNAALINIGS